MAPTRRSQTIETENNTQAVHSESEVSLNTPTNGDVTQNQRGRKRQTANTSRKKSKNTNVKGASETRIS